MAKEQDDWADQLRRAYAWFPKEVYCGAGWAPLIGDLCKNIQEFLNANEDYRRQFYVTQCKEKYGHLMFYAFPERHEIEQMIEEANARALCTCEVCGAPGNVGLESMEAGRNWVVVRCDRYKKG